MSESVGSKVNGGRGAQDERAELRYLWRNVLSRLLLLYFAPLLLIAIFFNFQYQSLSRESDRIHLMALAARRAASLDLFLSERLINISAVVGDPSFPWSPTEEELGQSLAQLKRSNPAFLELGCLGREGRLMAYTGALPSLETKSYARESWFLELAEGDRSYVITDNYRGFRDQPHFTVAVRRDLDGEYRVLRAVLSPDGIYEELTSGDEGEGLLFGLVNRDGVYQVVDPDLAEPLIQSSFRPPQAPRTGTAQRRGATGDSASYGYAWLDTSPWAVVVSGVRTQVAEGLFLGINRTVLLITALFLLVGLVAIWLHARTSVQRIWKARRTEKELSGQLVQAAKLASVGELAAGIAHEINNPLAIIAEEVGLLKDLMDPELGGGLEQEDLEEHLDTMHEAVFRGRDITRKLLGFVRKNEVKIEEHDIHEVLDEVAEDHLGREFELSNIKVVREYQADSSKLITDRNQLQQVLLNLMKNAFDAMGDQGTLTLRTSTERGLLRISITDTGCGMSREQMERVFQPFYTTKDPGKGTGLGLSVSQGIVESLGGAMFLDSVLREGSTFTIELPVDTDAVESTQSNISTDVGA